jgi:hypothetical protein
MDTPADSDNSNATQADIPGIDSPTPTSDAVLAVAGSDADTSTSTDTLRNQMPAGSDTPTGAIEVPRRERSDLLITLYTMSWDLQI